MESPPRLLSPEISRRIIGLYAQYYAIPHGGHYPEVDCKSCGRLLNITHPCNDLTYSWKLNPEICFYVFLKVTSVSPSEYLEYSPFWRNDYSFRRPAKFISAGEVRR